MKRWVLDLPKGHWCYCDADGTGRLFGPNGYAADISDCGPTAELFVRAHREGKECVGPDEIVESPRPERRVRRSLTF